MQGKKYCPIDCSYTRVNLEAKEIYLLKICFSKIYMHFVKHTKMQNGILTSVFLIFLTQQITVASSSSEEKHTAENCKVGEKWAEDYIAFECYSEGQEKGIRPICQFLLLQGYCRCTVEMDYCILTDCTPANKVNCKCVIIRDGEKFEVQLNYTFEASAVMVYQCIKESPSKMVFKPIGWLL